MRNFIGNVLIGLAAFITFSRNMLLFFIVVGIVLGVLMITIIGLFELIGKMQPDAEYPIVILGKWYWDVIALVLGGSTMWLGISKMFEEDRKSKKEKEYDMKKNYIYK